MLHGWGVLDSNWDVSSEIQHELRDGLSVTSELFQHGRHRNSAALSKNLDVDNRRSVLHHRSRNPGLPGGGGGYQVCGLYDVNPTKFGLVEEVVSLAKNYGHPVYQNHFINSPSMPGCAVTGSAVASTPAGRCGPHAASSIVLGNW